MTWYRTGTATVVNGSNAVAGTGTAWNTQAKAGEGFLGPDGALYEILSISSDVGIVLRIPYAGPTFMGGQYAIVPTQSYMKVLSSQVSDLLTLYQTAPSEAVEAAVVQAVAEAQTVIDDSRAELDGRVTAVQTAIDTAQASIDAKVSASSNSAQAAATSAASAAATLAGALTKTAAAASDGASNIGYAPDVSGAVKLTLSNLLSTTVSILSVIPWEQHAAIRAGTSTFDCQPAVQALIDQLASKGGPWTIIGEDGTFLCGSTLTLRQNVSLMGRSKGFTLKFNDAAKDGFVVAGTTQTKRSVSNLSITGTAKDFFVCASYPDSSVAGLLLDVANITIHATVGTNGITIANVYSASFENLYVFSGLAGCSNACIRLLATVNGVRFSGMYTTGVNHLHCLYIHNTEQPPGGSGLSYGHGIQLNSPTLQGGKYGLNVVSCNGLVVNNLYTENVANPVVLGTGLTTAVRAVVFNGGTITGPYVSNAYYAQRGPAIRLSGARGVTFNSIELYQLANMLPLTVSGGTPVQAAKVYMQINRDGSPAAYVIAECGRGYASAPTLTVPNPVTGVADTVTCTLTSGRVTALVVTAGTAPIYAASPSYPVAVLYGRGVNKVTFVSPYHGIGSDTIPFHAMVGRDSTDVGDGGINVIGDSATEGNTINFGRTEGFAGRHYVSFMTAAGVQDGFTRVIPVIPAP